MMKLEQPGERAKLIQTGVGPIIFEPVDSRGRKFHNFHVRKDAARKGWFIFGRNEQYGGTLVKMVAWPQRKLKQYQFPKGFDTKNLAEMACNELRYFGPKQNPKVRMGSLYILTDAHKDLRGEIQSTAPMWKKGSLITVTISGAGKSTGVENFTLTETWSEKTAKSYLKTMLVQAAQRHGKGQSYLPNPSRGDVDMHGARDLYYSTESYRECANQKRSIIQNLMLRKKKGIYKLDLATKLWRYWIDAGAKQYKRENGIAFNVPTRNAAAEMVTETEDAKMNAGEYGDIATYKRNPKKRGRKVYKSAGTKRAALSMKRYNAYRRRYNAYRREVKTARVKKNPTLRFILCVGKTGSKRMYFNGRTFSSELPPKSFPTSAIALHQGKALLSRFEILRKYRMTVEPMGK